MQPDFVPDFLQGHTLLHHIGMHHKSWGPWSQCVHEDHLQGAMSQIIQQLTHSGANINAKDIRVGATCNPKTCDREGLFAELSHSKCDHMCHHLSVTVCWDATICS